MLRQTADFLAELRALNRAPIKRKYQRLEERMIDVCGGGGVRGAVHVHRSDPGGGGAVHVHRSDPRGVGGGGDNR